MGTQKVSDWGLKKGPKSRIGTEEDLRDVVGERVRGETAEYIVCLGEFR